MTSFGGGLRGWLGYAGLVILFLVLAHLLVRRFGGWRRLYRRTRSELTRTGRALADPVTAQFRYRRRLRFLVGVLRDEWSWRDAEKAIGLAAQVSEAARPYAVVLAEGEVGVLVGGELPPHGPPEPWQTDAPEPRVWWITSANLDNASVASRHRPPDAPLLVCLGVENSGRSAVLVDLLAGPPTLAVYGTSRVAQTVVQSVAAQLDARLPTGAVEIADGIHRNYPGMSLTEAVNRLGAWFAIGPQPLPAALPAGMRLVSLGLGRGSAQLVEARPDGILRLHGAAEWLKVDSLPLPKAVARSIRSMPPHDFGGGMSLDPPATDDFDDLAVQPDATGVSALAPGSAGTDRKATSWT